MLRLLTFCSAALLASASLAQVHVVVDHVGYETKAPKQALVVVEGSKGQAVPQSFTLLDAATGESLLSGPVTSAGTVDRWRGRAFWTADFSSWAKPGHYVLPVKT